MRIRRGPCPSCPRGRLMLVEDGDTVCSRCSYRERAANVRRFTFRALKGREEPVA